MEFLVVVLLAIVALGVWNVARTHRATLLQRDADGRHARLAADAAVAVQSFTTLVADVPPTVSALPVASPAARDAARAAVEAAESAAGEAQESVDLMRELLAKGFPRGIAWTEWGDKDPSRDLVKEAENTREHAAQAARDARRAFASGSAHPRILGEVAIHVHRAAHATLEANGTAYEAVEHDHKDRDLAQREMEVHQRARNAAIRAQEAALSLGAHTHTTEPPGSAGAIIATIVETYRADAEAFAAHRTVSAAENASYNLVEKLKNAPTREDIEAARAGIEEYKRLCAVAAKSYETANIAAEAADSAWNVAFDAREAATDELRAGDVTVTAKEAITRAEWLATAAADAAEAARCWVESGVDEEGRKRDRVKDRIETLEWAYSEALKATEAAVSSGGGGPSR